MPLIGFKSFFEKNFVIDRATTEVHYVVKSNFPCHHLL